MYHVLLYYFYNTIKNVDEEVKAHKAFCKANKILGRVYITSEGINGTVSGLKEDIENYKTYLETHPLFNGIVFKESVHETHTFKKIIVKNKNELVNLSLEDDVNPKEITGRYIEPVEFYERVHDPETVIIDARNDYEYDMGHFKGALRPNIRAFRELPDWVRANKEKLEGKKIIAYCTGGVRCEKFTGWLKKEGYEDVGQLHGGIQTYGANEQTKGEFWEGSMYVFDERIGMPINQVSPVIVSKDQYTNEPCERMFNCANPDCNEQIFGSEKNQHEHIGGCSLFCSLHPRNRYAKELDPDTLESLKSHLLSKPFYLHIPKSTQEEARV